MNGICHSQNVNVLLVISAFHSVKRIFCKIFKLTLSCKTASIKACCVIPPSRHIKHPYHLRYVELPDKAAESGACGPVTACIFSFCHCQFYIVFV